MSLGVPRRPKVSTQLGNPNPREGSDGDIQIKGTALGAKLWGKWSGRWWDVPLSRDGVTKFGVTDSNYLSIDRDSVDIFTNKVKVASFGSTTTVKDINLTGKITIVGAGTRNVCIGVDNADVGADNILLGSGAGEDSTSYVQRNIIIGTEAGKVIGTGASSNIQQNVIIGYQAAIKLTLGAKNIIIGSLAGGELLDGLNNVLVGYQAGDVITSNNNTCIGVLAGDTIADGAFNACIGGLSDGEAGSDYQVAIGYNALVSGDNGIALGRVTAASDTFRVGKPSNYITASFSGTQTFDVTSDRRKKRNINDNPLGLEFLNDIKTRTFQWKSASEFPEEWKAYHYDDSGNRVYDEMDTETLRYGLIAQEVKESMGKFDADDFPGWNVDPKGIQEVSKESFIMPLIKAVQELSAKLDTMQTEINNLK